MKFMFNGKYFVLYILIMICMKLGLKEVMNHNLPAAVMVDSMGLICFWTLIYIAYKYGESDAKKAIDTEDSKSKK
ncbi:hypothetical protein DVH26_19120 [Paenibacillus sp. H1-7]|nr:hypothetical protein DVH26_19120 [Paenibacillus sp. H1-7]